MSESDVALEVSEAYRAHGLTYDPATSRGIYKELVDKLQSEGIPLHEANTEAMAIMQEVEASRRAEQVPSVLPAAPESKPSKEPKPKEEKKAEEVPAGVPTTEWAKWTTPIKGYTWHAKLWKDMNPFTRVYVLMVQFAVLDMIEKGKAWDGVWRCHASRKSACCSSIDEYYLFDCSIRT